MDQDHLRALLIQLQNEIAGTEKLDDRNHELLRGIQADVQRAVDHSDPARPPVEPERQSRWQEAIVSLESSHPQLAAALEQGMVTLSNMGL